MNSNSKHILKTLLFFAIYFLPPFFIFVNWIDYKYRYHIMAPVIIGVAIYAIFQKFKTKQLGMRWDNFWDAFKWQFGVSVGMTVFVLILVYNNYVRDLEPPQSLWFYMMYLFISGPVQEFTYRGVPFAELDKYENMPAWMKVGIVTLNFTWLHVIYFDWIIIIATLIIGFIWTIIYHNKRNLWAVSIAHAICGLLAIWNGLV